MGIVGSSGVLEVCMLFSHSSTRERSGSSTIRILKVVLFALGICCPAEFGVSWQALGGISNPASLVTSSWGKEDIWCTSSHFLFLAFSFLELVSE